MGLKLLFILSFSFTAIQAISQSPGLNKENFYKVISRDNIDAIDTQLTKLEGWPTPDKYAYEGALLMKKSGLVKNAKEKLRLFKSGREKLETSILKNNNNIEFRLLRVIIQEHAPKVVKYRNKLEEDTELITSRYKSLSQELRAIILDYSKKSKFLKVQNS